MQKFKKTIFFILIITLFSLISSGTVFAFTESNLEFVNFISERNNIKDIEIDSEGNIYLTFNEKSYIKKYDKTGSLLATWGNADGTSSSENGKFNNPHGITIKNENGTDYVYVSDTDNARIQKLNTNGLFITEYKYESNKPNDIAIDKNGNIYAIFSEANKIMKYEKSNSSWNEMFFEYVYEPDILPLVTLLNSSEIIITKGNQVFITSGGELYKLTQYDDDNYEMDIFWDEPPWRHYDHTAFGEMPIIWYEMGGICGVTGKMPGYEHHFGGVIGIATDNDNNVYFTQIYSEGTKTYKKIQKYKNSYELKQKDYGSSGIVHRYVSSFIKLESYGKDWSSTEETYLNSPTKIALDSNGNIFVVDGNKVKLLDKIKPSVIFSPNGNDNYSKDYNVTVNINDNEPSSGEAADFKYQYIWSKSSGRVSFNPNKTFESVEDITTDNETLDIGTYYLHVKIRDKSGNEKIAVSNGFKIDKIGPSVTFTPNEGVNSRPDYEINISVSDNNGIKMDTLKYIFCKTDDGEPNHPDEGGWNSWPNTTDSSIKVKMSESLILENGSYKLWVYGKDNLDNESKISSSAFIIDKDISPINISSSGISANLENNSEYNQDYNIEVSTFDGNDVNIYYQWTSSQDQPPENSENWIITDGDNINYGQNFSGTKYIHVKSIVDGNIYYEKRELLFDNEVPTITLESNSSTFPRKSVSTIVQANDNISNQIYEFYAKWMLKSELDIDANNWNDSIVFTDNDITTKSAAQLDTGNGEYILFIKAVDDVGNETIIHSGDFVLDNTPPAGSIDIENTTITTNIINVILHVNDNNSNKDNIRYIYSTDGGSTWSKQWIPVLDGLEVTLKSYEKNQNLSVEVKYKDEAGNISDAVDVEKGIVFNPEGVITWIEYSTLDWTNDNVIATIKHNGEIEILNNNGSESYIFEDNGVFYFEIKEKDDNTRSVKSQVYNIDKEVLIPDILKSTILPTNESVYVTLEPKEQINILNNDGSLGYIFSDLDDDGSLEYEFDENGSFTLNIEDSVGNTTTANFVIDNIDKSSPILNYTKNITEKTNESVTVEISANEPIVILNNLGSNRKVFNQNGDFTFKAKDYAGNVSEITVIVDNIDREPPNVWIEYSDTNLTKETIKSTVRSNEEFIVVNNGGNKEYTFNDNGRFYFKVSDDAGNEIMTEAYVDNIDKTKPIITFTGDDHLIFIKDDNTYVLDDYIAYDNKSGYITHEVILDENGFDIFTEGTYEVIYSVSDEAGNECKVNRKITVISSDTLKIYINGIDSDQDEVIKINSKQIDLNILNHQGNYKIKWKKGKHLSNSMKYNSNIVEGQAFAVDEKGWYTIYFRDQEKNTRLIQIFSY